MKISNPYLFALLVVCLMAGFGSCDEDDDAVKTHDINTAENVSVDRFSATAGHLMVRDAVNGLPAVNIVVNSYQDNFITKGLGHLGKVGEYYNFDVQPVNTAPTDVLFRAGVSFPVYC